VVNEQVTNIDSSYTSAPTVVPTTAVDTYTPPAVTGYPTATGTGSGPSYGNGTSTTGPTGGSSGPATPSATDVFEGAANRATVAGGALFGLLGVVAYLL
jgi:hypothetical protein